MTTSTSTISKPSDSAEHSPAVAPRASDKLTGVIVTYKSSKTISAALASAKRCAEDASLNRDGLGFHLVVVDNATPAPDRTREILANEAGFAQVILGYENVGFGRGCNVGLRATTTPYVVFFNPDAQMEPEAVRTIIEFMESHPRCAIAGPAIVHGGAGSDVEQHVQPVGALATPLDLVGDAMGLYRSMKKRQAVSLGAEPFRTEWVSGAMLVGRTKVLQELGGFDPRFFLYWEETDLCRRVLDAGHEIWAIPQAVVHHIGGVSAAEESSDRVKGCIAEHYYKSRHYYFRKHFGLVAAAMADVGEAIFMPMHEAFRKIRGKKSNGIFRRWGHPMMRVPREAVSSEQ